MIKRTTHNWDVVKPKPSAPQALDGVEGWERILADPVDLEGLKYKKVVQVMYRNKGTGEIVCTLEMSGTDRRCRGKSLSGNLQYFQEVVYHFLSPDKQS
jgi:hypothetical protein